MITKINELDMIAQVHLAAQYLAAAGISFLEKEADDSHTNLGFDVEARILFSRSLNSKGDYLAFNYDRFSLEWKSKNNPAYLPLDGANHKAIITWIRDKSKESGINKEYRYEFHYSLPYIINDELTYELTNSNALQEQKEVRAFAQLAIEAFLQWQKLDSEIRIWPHHFDSGVFLELNDTRNISIGMGLAIPDELCNEFYYYISGFKNRISIDPDGFKPLTNGEWISKGFKGAILPSSAANEDSVHRFLDEAFTVLSS